jgi:hypothetical protein
LIHPRISETQPLIASAKKLRRVGKTFTYVGKEVTHITKIFRKQNLEGAFKTKNNIRKVLSMNKVALQRTKYEISGVYQLRCPDCNLVYIGQTGRQFKIRYHEHLLAFNYYYYYYYYYALAQYVIKMDVPW